MKIQEALKETGKAQHEDYPNRLVEVGLSGFLNWYIENAPHVLKGRVRYATAMSNKWQPYHSRSCICKSCQNEENKLKDNLDGQAIFYCEKTTKCKWQCFALHRGMGWGKIPLLYPDGWRDWHERKCGGKLIQGRIVVDAV